MEDYFYIILLVIWLVVSIVKRSNKARAKMAQPKAQPDATTSMPKETQLEELLEDFFGSGKKKKQEAAVEKTPAAIEMTEEYDESGPEYGSREVAGRQSNREYGYQSWMSEAQRAFNEQREDVPELTSSMPEYTGFDMPETKGAKMQAGLENIVSIDDLIKSNAAKDALEQARAEMEYQEKGVGSEIPEFDVRKAVIFSEILNRKYT